MVAIFVFGPNFGMVIFLSFPPLEWLKDNCKPELCMTGFQSSAKRSLQQTAEKTLPYTCHTLYLLFLGLLGQQ